MKIVDLTLTEWNLKGEKGQYIKLYSPLFGSSVRFLTDYETFCIIEGDHAILDQLYCVSPSARNQLRDYVYDRLVDMLIRGNTKLFKDSSSIVMDRDLVTVYETNGMSIVDVRWFKKNKPYDYTEIAARSEELKNSLEIEEIEDEVPNGPR